MHTVKKWSLAVPTVALAAVLAAGCGGSSKPKAARTTTSSTTASTTTTTLATTTTTAAPTTTTAAVNKAALAARAAAANIRASDLPASMQKTQPAGQGLNIETIWSSILSCTGVAQAPPLAQASSPTFLQGIATQARSTVEYTTAAQVATLEAAFTSPKYQGCATAAFNADAKHSAPQGATPGPSVVKPLSFPTFGQKTFASHINVTMSLQGLQIFINQDYIVVFNGGTIDRFFFLNPGGPFPPALEQQLVQKVVTRAG